MQTHTVTAVAVTSVDDGLGNTSETTATTSASNIYFAPEGVVENANSAAPRVIGDATLYGVLPPLDSDDTITHTETCCDGADFAHGTWQVVGGSKGWGGGRKVIAIRRTASA